MTAEVQSFLTEQEKQKGRTKRFGMCIKNLYGDCTEKETETWKSF